MRGLNSRIKVTELCFPVVMLICSTIERMLEPVGEFLKFAHSNNGHCVVLSCGAVCYAVGGGSNF